MKKLVSTAILFSIILVFSACSNEETDAPQAIVKTETFTNEANFTQQFADLNSQLQTLNQQYPVFQEGELRGKSFKEIMVIVLADVEGFVKGYASSGNWLIAVFNGAIASIKAAEGSFAISSAAPPSLVPLSPNLTIGDSIGYFHNNIIADLFVEYPDIQTQSDDLLLQKITEKAKKYGFNATKEEYRLLGELQSANPKNSFKLFKQLYPKESESIDIIESYANNIAKFSSEKEVLKYTTEFRDIVINSKIPKSSVNLIKGGITVGMNSNALWIVK
jgi:hypothetical protein